MSDLLGLKTDAPVVCGVCLRRSGNIGAIEIPGWGPVLWLCDGCKTTMGHKVLEMNTMRLDALESSAVKAAMKGAAEHVVGAVFGLAFEQGFTDLKTMAPEQFRSVARLAADSKELQGAVAMLLVSYSNEMRRLVAVEK